MVLLIQLQKNLIGLKQAEYIPMALTKYKEKRYFKESPETTGGKTEMQNALCQHGPRSWKVPEMS